MKKTSRLFVLMFLAVALFACSSDTQEEGTITTSPVNEGGYRIAIPFESSDATQIHVNYNRSSADIDAIGKGLQRLSKEHFSTGTYYLQDGQILQHDDLVKTFSNKESLLGRKSAENAFGLNPEKGSSLPINETQSIKVGTDTVPVGDVIEYNFVKDSNKDAQIEGIAFAIVLTPNVVGEDGQKYTIKDKQLKVIGEEAGRNLMTYVKDLPEVGNNTPVMIALFKATSEDDTLPGTFFAKGYGKSNIDNFTAINEKYAVIPSDTASKLDPQVVSQFDAVKKSLFRFLPNDIAIIGQGFFVDDQLDRLMITISTQGKTQIQNEAVVQYVKELLANFNSDSYKVIVKMNANTDTYAMLQREKGSMDVSVIMN